MGDNFILHSRLILGTVQFGCDYGINNKEGQIAAAEVFKILDYAAEKGLSLLDTAADYGESEKVIGDYLATSKHKFDIITKLNSGKKVEQFLKESIKRLKIRQLYGCLIHSFSIYEKEPEAYTSLRICQKKGLVKKTGFSIYHPRELEQLWQDGVLFDIIQIPYSVFDQRFAPYFKELKEKGVEIHVRSVFLQGLYFRESENLESYFLPLARNLNKLKKMSVELEQPLASLCLNFVLYNPLIDKIIIGVDSKDNLMENMKAVLEGEISSEVYQELSNLRVDDERLILPYKWPKF